MVPTNDKPPGAEDDDHYDRYFHLLVKLGTEELYISREAAETLAHEILVASIRHVSTQPDIETWLRQSMTAAAERLKKAES